MKKTIIYQFIVLISCLLFSCKNTSGDNDAPSITVNSIVPNNGAKETEVVLSGTGFDEVAANNTVLFNGKAAEVLEATATSLTVKSPAGAGTGKVEVSTKSGKEGVGPVFYHRWTANVGTLAIQGFVLDNLQGIATDGNSNIYVTNGQGGKIFKTTINGEGSTFKTIDGTTQGIVIDNQNNIFVVNEVKHRIEKITNGVATVFAGSANGTKGYSDATGTSALFDFPADLAIDKSNNLYVMDTGNDKVRKITPAGVVTTISTNVEDVCEVDLDGNIYIGEHTQIKKISPSDQLLATIGVGEAGFLDGIFSKAKFEGITDIFFSTQGNTKGDIFTAEFQNNRLRYLSQDGQVITLIGNGLAANKNGVGVEAQIKEPKEIAIDKDGIMWANSNGAIRRIVLD